MSRPTYVAQTVWLVPCGLAALWLAIAGGCNNAANNVASSDTQGSAGATSNEFGYAKKSSSVGDVYQEGIVDKNGRIIVPLSPDLSVKDITGKTAVIQVGPKFLFVPLDKGPFTKKDIDSVDGFDYAEPFRCGLAVVAVDDDWFYLRPDGDLAFKTTFEFAETFHNDRALVMSDDFYHIIDTSGQVVAKLDYDEVNPQSPWCWQVTKELDSGYMNGFIDLEGKPITDLIYEEVGDFQPEINRILVARNGLHGFVDERAKLIIPLIYQAAEIFDGGKAKVTRDGKTLFINPNGDEVPE